MKNILLDRIKTSIKTKTFIKRLNNRLILGLGKDPEATIISQHKYKETIRGFIAKLDYNLYEFSDFIANVDSYEDVIKSFKVTKKAKTIGVEEYIDFATVIKILKRDYDPDFYFELAKDFKNYKLEENGQGDFIKLRNYVDIPEADLKKIVDVMLFTKNAGFPLTQKNIIKYYDSKRPESEDILKLKEAWIFANEHKIEVDIKDFIQAIKYKRDVLNYVINYNNIIKNDIPISYEKFKIFNIEQSKIEELIGLLIKAKLAKIYLEFETIYDDIKQDRDVWSIIRYLIKFRDSDFSEFEYEDLRTFAIYGCDLSKLHNAYLYNRKFKVIDSKKFYDSALEILLVKNEKLDFDTNLYLKAMELGKSDDFKIPEDEIIHDYLAGHDVFNILNYIKYARSHNVNVSYSVAKALDNLPLNFKDIINESLNPMILTGDSVRVTTKDNIEITANLEIEAVIQLDNYIKGSEKDVLFSRANAIFIDEVQRKYNHDEIVTNVEKIANNILFRLMNESRDRKYFYVPDKKMNKIFDDQKRTSENEDLIMDYNNSDHNESLKFIDVSKYKPLKVLIPRINFVEDTFKDYDKIKEEFEIHKKKAEAEIDQIKAEIELKKAWANSKDLKYMILKDDEKSSWNKH